MSQRLRVLTPLLIVLALAVLALMLPSLLVMKGAS